MLAFLALLASAAPVAATAAGPAACANITTQLGSSNVVSSEHSQSYVESIEYWSTLQDAYKPSCVVYPKSAQDVSIALQAI
jgi:DNA mismatch repair ATPase MutS